MASEALPPVPPPPKFTADEIGPHCLVTGGAGYLGSAIIKRLLAAGCRVRSLDVVPHSAPEGVETVTGDLRDAEAIAGAFAGIDTVFHTAALIRLESIYRPAVRRFVDEVNIGGTANTVRAAASAGCTALVHTSTFNVALEGDTPDGDESTPYVSKPRDLYSRTKIEAEKIALAADGENGLRTAALRPGGVWGCDTGSIMIQSILTALAKDQFKILIGSGDSRMDNTHVENLVDAQLLAAKALREKPEQVGGQPYFIMDDESYNPLEWFRPLIEGLGYPFPTRRLPGGLMYAVATLVELTQLWRHAPPNLTQRGIRNLTEHGHFSIERARSELGYAPRWDRANGFPRLLPSARAFIDDIRARPRTGHAPA